MHLAPNDTTPLSELTLHEIVRRLPGSRDVLLAHGLDLCCGGELPLREAARLHGLDLEALIEAVIQARGDVPDGGAAGA